MNPVLYKHLETSASHKRFYFFLAGYLSLCTLFALGPFIAVLTGLSDNSFSLQEVYSGAQVVYFTLSAMLLIFATLLLPISALTSFSGEYEHRTWDLLKITTLDVRALVMGKLGSALATGGLYLLAPLPLLLISSWLNATGLSALLITLLFIGITLLATNSLAQWLSITLKRTVWALFAYYSIVLGSLIMIATVVLISNAIVSNLSRMPATPTASPAQILLEALIEYGWVLIVALHPISSALAGINLALETENWFFSYLPLSRYPSVTLPVPNPWILTVLYLLLLSLLWLRLTIRAVERAER